jgi:Zn-dependent alcohol dehydrogenase
LEKITSDIEDIDYVFECVGNTDTMTLAYEFTVINGTVVIIGCALY